MDVVAADAVAAAAAAYSPNWVYRGLDQNTKQLPAAYLPLPEHIQLFADAACSQLRAELAQPTASSKTEKE